MKKLMMFLGIITFMSIPFNSALAWDMSYLNPLPYVGIGCNQTKFSLNPFKGFKNCEPCKRVKKCEMRTAVIEPIQCNSCQRAYILEVPQCGCQHR